MLGQLNIEGKDKVQAAIERLKMFEPAQGYYLAFSGGKDSEVIKRLAIMAGVKFDAHYHLTTVDPPELIQHMREHHKDVIMEKPDDTMWTLIPKKLMPPTRMVRYCCDVLKEQGGKGRVVVTGVRWAESARRKNSRKSVEFDAYGSQSKDIKEKRKVFMMSDNEEKRKMIDTCQPKGQHIVNPIIEWTDKDVWDFIKEQEIPYCKLYDEGFDRLGCIGCPLSKNQYRELELYPKFKEAYIRAFDRMIKERKRKGKTTKWESGEEVMEWWLGK